MDNPPFQRGVVSTDDERRTRLANQSWKKPCARVGVEVVVRIGDVSWYVYGVRFAGPYRILAKARFSSVEGMDPLQRPNACTWPSILEIFRFRCLPIRSDFYDEMIDCRIEEYLTRTFFWFGLKMVAKPAPTIRLPPPTHASLPTNNQQTTNNEGQPFAVTSRVTFFCL